ncbi:DnaJ-domain-containing protein [Irpex rosettiformis]|uniref:DnaJ-domain-containing protein n=1 Tax=Irpex rosettiformis TaxID=378272 RepID=A0ACB8UEH5_9APHY|nr:DnaJ-domain-containing protein [Irpex rosettiformis]
MADYNYDESGNMALYFVLTFLLVILIPLTITSPGSLRQKQVKDGCLCDECVRHRNSIRPGIFTAKVQRRSLLLVVGWSIFGFLAYKATTAKIENKVYNPFEILDIGTGTSVKEIKSHYKKLSRKFHPDKVKLGVNQTMEAVEAYFVEITKAYKALTDETIKENWEKYGHPDGRQEVSMGIALPKGIIEGRSRMFVLAGYALVFGGFLPALVGRWWFGNREKTKDGVNARSAATFFKSLTEESSIDDVVASLGKSFEYERSAVSKQAKEIDELEEEIEKALGQKWNTLKSLAEILPKQYQARRRAFILLYAHLLRLPIPGASLRKEQSSVLLQTPALLNSLLNIVTSRNWLGPTLAAMRLHAYLAQALLPGDTSLQLAQLPGISQPEGRRLLHEFNSIETVASNLEKKGDSRAIDIKKAVSRWSRLELVDASFKVIGERIVPPLAIVYLVVKLRIAPPSSTSSEKDKEKDQKTAATLEKSDDEFLSSRKEADDMPEGASDGGWAHAPHWPATRKPSWWVVLADPKLGRVVVPPMQVTDVPLANPDLEQDYRTYKLQFQAPPNIMTFSWKLYIVSDTFVGEEIARDILLKIEEPPQEAAEEEDDDISDPEEDSLAGQMALMRGGKVKKRPEGDEESDDESSTDDDKKDEDSDSSDDD